MKITEQTIINKIRNIRNLNIFEQCISKYSEYIMKFASPKILKSLDNDIDLIINKTNK